MIMNKILILSLAALMAAALFAGCSNETEEPATSSNENESTALLYQGHASLRLTAGNGAAIYVADALLFFGS